MARHGNSELYAPCVLAFNQTCLNRLSVTIPHIRCVGDLRRLGKCVSAPPPRRRLSACRPRSSHQTQTVVA